METTEASTAESVGKKDVYAIVTDRIIDQLNKGTVPWRKPWKEAGLPRNLISQKLYRGINMMLLASLGYEHNQFLTYKQLQEHGGKVKKDERSHLVVFWNYGDKDKETAKAEDEPIGKKKAILRYYNVFNIAQCDGLPEQILPKNSEQAKVEPLPMCEAIVTGMPNIPRIQHKEHQAYYNPLHDIVNMPKKSSFETVESYYGTLFHELVHSTGHRSRLARRDLLDMHEFGSEAYSHEELVAEIGTCYLQSVAGIDTQFQQSTAYIQGWLQKLQNDRRFIFSASSQAQKATDYILNVQQEPEETTEPVEE